MAETLALLSGKGGSGKTSLALSIASLLSRLKIKVLLVDSDLSTNGATYFYESRLAQNKDTIDSFFSVFVERSEKSYSRIQTDRISNTFSLNLVKINEHLDFMPSITKINNNIVEERKSLKSNYIRSLFDLLRSQYDVIIFDCQAGYTSSLDIFLPYVDVNLVVMETDAISSASIRSLYLKVGHLMNEKKMYQVFNKATKEEYETYSKLLGGTVFTNIETILFDWNIRRAFAVSQVPDIESTSAVYGEQLYNICKVLFKDVSIQERLDGFVDYIKLNKIREQEKIAKEDLDKLLDKKASSFSKTFKHTLIPLFSAIIAAMLYLIIEYYFERVWQDSLFMIVVVILIIGVFYAFISSDLFERRRQNISIDEARQETYRIREEKLSLIKKIEETEKSQSSK